MSLPLDLTGVLATLQYHGGVLVTNPRPKTRSTAKKREAAERFVEPEGYVIYTDGALRRILRRGSFAIIVVKDHQIIHELGHATGATTNNRMELGGVLWALQYIRHYQLQGPVTIYSDSEYCVNSVTRWGPTWQRNGWRRTDGAAVQNQDLLERIFALLAQLAPPPSVCWLSGHHGIPGNERADAVATALVDDTAITLVRRPPDASTTSCLPV